MNDVYDRNNGSCCTKHHKQGCYGRIGCGREIFKSAGGYDEGLLPVSSHDLDFIIRCERYFNYKFMEHNNHMIPITNSKEDTIKYIKNYNINWDSIVLENSKRIRHNIINEIACPNIIFTKCCFVHNFNNLVNLDSGFEKDE
jgi:hypothetical protein